MFQNCWSIRFLVQLKAPEEVAEAHEAWQLAMEEAQKEGNESLGKVAVERLLLGWAMLSLSE